MSTEHKSDLISLIQINKEFKDGGKRRKNVPGYSWLPFFFSQTLVNGFGKKEKVNIVYKDE